MTHSNFRAHLLLCVLLASVSALLPGRVESQVVELNPVPLGGTIRIGDNLVRTLTVTATSSVGSSTVQLTPNAVDAVYSTIVQVPADGSAVYRITVDAGLTSADGTQLYSFRFEKSLGTLVRDGEPATIDLVMDPATRVEATVTAFPGELLDNVSLRAQRFGSGGFAFFITALDAPPGGAETLTLDLPVAPGIQLNCAGSANMTNGRGAALEPFQLVTVPEGDVGTCAFDVAPPPMLEGSISGTLDFEGDLSVDQYEVFVRAVSGGGGSSLPNQVLLPPFTGPGNRTGYEFPQVEEGEYNVDLAIDLNDGIDRLTARLATRVGVTGDTVVHGQFCQAYLETSFSLGGVTRPEDWEFGERPVSLGRLGDGLSSSSTPLDPRAGGPFRFVLREGTWRQGMSFAIRRESFEPGGFMNTRTTGTGFRFEQNLPVACGETVVAPVRVLETGRVEIHFQSTDGSFLQDPLIRAFCSHRDEQTAEVIYSYETLSSSSSSASLPVGIVPVEAPAGVCTFTATARVGNVNVSFGSLNDFEILPGVDVEIGLGGPRVEILSPVPGEIVEDDEIVVEGLATDDGEVVSVVVNGVPALLQSTDNPSDPAEVSFSAVVPIANGPNVITAVATDDDANQTQASLGIENLREDEPPLLCDVDGNGVVDALDVGLIFAARGNLASGPDDPRDSNGDGVISVNDGRLCVLHCTNPRCQP